MAESKLQQEIYTTIIITHFTLLVQSFYYPVDVISILVKKGSLRSVLIDICYLMLVHSYTIVQLVC